MLEVTTREGVLTITFDRPDKFNAFNRELALGVQEALRLAATDAAVRCVVITGAGKAFCAGQDLGEAIAEDGPTLRDIVAKHYNPIIKAIRELPKPVIAAVNGVAAGAGANIALACDIVIAHEKASFVQAFSKIGLIPDSGGTFTLPRLVGFQHASALMMTATRYRLRKHNAWVWCIKYFRTKATKEKLRHWHCAWLRCRLKVWH